LFDDHPALAPGRDVYMVEAELFFRHVSFHKQKIAFHRASMQAYAARLKKKGYKVHYIESVSEESATEALLNSLSTAGIREIQLCDPCDYLLERRLNRYARRFHIKLSILPSPSFLDTKDYGREFFGNRKKFFLTEYYIAQRKRFGILLEGCENPLGGRWTYDTENRKRLPKGYQSPALNWPSGDAIWAESLKYISENYSQNPGISGTVIYPYTHREAEKWLDRFLEQRFRLYGDYQDAIEPDETFLYHSIISPMLNAGLLEPSLVLHRAAEAAAEYNVPLNALEGFIRQVLGWREFIRHVYTLKGTDQRTRNYFNHERRIPKSFYTGTTGIDPVDAAIRRTLKYGYTHHIERLMVLGNFMVLCEFDPDEVYRWFMELYIDAYDWVMVPNVYGMSQYADGGLMSTKPYISGSNYILKMSHYSKGSWCETWDALYWRFIHLHRDFFLRNPRMSMMVRQTEKMGDVKLRQHLRRAEHFLNSLH
jgi:deoxyribodipyrimidine photolyase-related protein